MKTKQQKHGFSKHPLYRVRKSMIERTTNINNCHYNLYGGRGIKVCKEWLINPLSFFEWALKNGYKKGLSIDRIDNDGDYCPQNCRWANQKQQNRNTRRNNFLTFNGKTLCITDWANNLGFSHAAGIRNRIKSGWNIKDALTIPANESDYNNYFLLNGKKINLSKLCKEVGFNKFNYYARKKRDLNKIEDIFKGVDFKKHKIEELKNE